MLNRTLWHWRWQMLFLACVFVAHGLMVYHGITRQQERWHVENGWLENLQVFYLSLAVIGFALGGRAFSDRHSGLFYFLSMVAVLFIIREVEFGELAIPSWMQFMLADAGRAFFYLIAIALLVKQVTQLPNYWQQRQVYLAMPLFWYLLASAVFLLVFSLMFDRQFIDIHHYQLLEEASEAVAYMLCLGGALFGYAGIKNHCPSSVNTTPKWTNVPGPEDSESTYTVIDRFLSSQRHNR